MDWPTQDANDEEQERRRRKLPWRERHNWGEILVIAILILGFIAAWIVFL
jgi:hypothetical protein